ncbi:MAG: DUF1330 domain-containing protein [Mucilaginibacter sp.]
MSKIDKIIYFAVVMIQHRKRSRRIVSFELKNIINLTTTTMSAYIVFIREKTTNKAELDTYINLLPTAMEGVTFKPVVAYGEQKVIEGPEVEGVVILEFPSFKDAEDWYNSPAYQEIIQHRFDGAVYTGVIVEGAKPKA